MTLQELFENTEAGNSNIKVTIFRSFAPEPADVTPKKVPMEEVSL